VSSILGHPHAELSSLIDVRPAEACAVGEFLTGDVSWHNSLEEFLASKNLPEVVCVCTPNGLHAEQAIALLEAGCNVVLEKPIALNVVDAKRVEAAAEKSTADVFCVMQNRFAPPSAWLKELVDSGKLGEIRQVHIQCYWNRDDRYYEKGGWRGTMDLDGGPLFTQFS